MFSRIVKIGILVLGVLFGLHAHAQTCTAASWTGCPFGTAVGGPFGSAQAAGEACAALVNAFVGTCNVSGFTADCPMFNTADHSTRIADPSFSTASTTCGPCSAIQGQSFTIFVGGGMVAANGSAMCGADSCAYTASNSANARNMVASDGNGHQLIMQDGTATGSTCTVSGGSTGPLNAQPGQQSNNGTANATCASAGGNIACETQSNTGKNCGTYNGDQICVSDIPQGTCASFASGGVACTQATGANAAQSPPVPNNGTAGTPATPTETVTTPQGTTNYYGAGTVKGSTAAVVTAGAGAAAVTGGAITGTGTGTGTSGTGASAANGDCGASSANCAGDGSVPDLPDVPTVQSSTNTYISAIQGAPIVSAISNIGASIPSGVCPVVTIPLSIFGKSQTYTMDSQCTLWNSAASIMGSIMLVVYTLLAVRILMTA